MGTEEIIFIYYGKSPIKKLFGIGPIIRFVAVYILLALFLKGADSFRVKMQIWQCDNEIHSRVAFQKLSFLCAHAVYKGI
jgi:hypothetical protein